MIPRGVVPAKSSLRKVRSLPGKNANQLVTKSQVKQMIKSAVDYETEDKFFDVLVNSGYNIDYDGGVPFSLSDVPQGSSDTTRDGDTILVKSLEYSCFVRYNQTNTTTNLATATSFVRLLIFRWLPFFADVAPTVGKVFTYTGAYYAAEAPLSHDGRDQFEVLVDRYTVLGPYYNQAHCFRGKVNINKRIQYKAGSTTNQSHGIYATLISDALTGGGAFPNVLHAAYRINFTDA